MHYRAALGVDGQEECLEDKILGRCFRVESGVTTKVGVRKSVHSAFIRNRGIIKTTVRLGLKTLKFTFFCIYQEYIQ